MQDSDLQTPPPQAADAAQRKAYRPPQLTCFGPVALLTGEDMSGSAFDAKFGDYVGMAPMGAGLPGSL